MSGRYWVRRILLPIMFVLAVAVGVGVLPHFSLDPSFMRVCVTTGLVELTLLPLSWFLILETEEREYLLARIRMFMVRVKGG